MFRLTDYTLVRDSGVALRETINAAREMVRCLGASVAGDGVLQGQLLRAPNGAVSSASYQSEKELHSAVIEALLAFRTRSGKNLQVFPKSQRR
jgi:hypothetical protein